MQRGQIYKKNGAWLLRYWDITTTGRVRKAVKLAPISDEYPSKRSVLLLAEKHLQPINSGQLQPESALLVTDFIENIYLPYVEKELRPSTYKHYKKDMYEKHVKSLLGDLRLRDFRTVHGQKLVRNINVGRRTLIHVKVFLSAAFKHAKREGILDGENPMRDVSVPGRPDPRDTRTYSMDEIERICDAVAKVDQVAFTAIAVAAFAGLRASEIRGLRWTDYDGNTLVISRSVWRTHVGPTKTVKSAGAVPVLPTLKKFLDEHRVRVNGTADQYIFAGERRGAPLNLHNLTQRVIVPALKKAMDEDETPYAELARPIIWKGWHAFRRALSSNLYDCGVHPKVIQAIMRHSDIGTTLDFYIKTPDAAARAAMDKIEELIAN
jgi:integrase